MLDFYFMTVGGSNFVYSLHRKCKPKSCAPKRRATTVFDIDSLSVFVGAHAFSPCFHFGVTVVAAQMSLLSDILKILKFECLILQKMSYFNYKISIICKLII